MERMPFEEISHRDRLRPELAFVAIVDTGHDEPAIDGDWHSEALCREMDGDIFFPERGRSARDARIVCARCDVKDQCLEERLAIPAHDDDGGIWAGTTARERRKLRKDRKPDSSASDL